MTVYFNIFHYFIDMFDDRPISTWCIIPILYTATKLL
uniref:Uncharacterized protein n=1 Tax=Lepeophtheirus salmonis TaxID=72036 RepID=A0A0K2TSQ4_LEPSM